MTETTNSRPTAPIKWTRTAGNGNGGLKSADGRYEIIKHVDWILGTKCVSFVLYADKKRQPGYHKQAECKALAQQLADAS